MRTPTPEEFRRYAEENLIRGLKETGNSVSSFNYRNLMATEAVAYLLMADVIEEQEAKQN